MFPVLLRRKCPSKVHSPCISRRRIQEDERADKGDFTSHSFKTQGEYTMSARTGSMRVMTILAVGAIGLAFTVRINAQVKSSSDTAAGTASHQVKVERAEVVLVDGNDLVLKMEDGSIRHMANVPESSRVTVDGREVGIHELKPGMHLQKTITTITTPKVITTTQTVTGKVWHVNPPLSVTLSMEDGTNQTFKIP